MDYKIVKIEKMNSGEWLCLENIEYADSEGKPYLWEAVMRVGGMGAVAVFAEMIPSERIILVRQFRPPAEGYVIEFPAGLIDEGEAPEETALRELYEETGYKAELSDILPPSYSSPGITGETVQIVKVTVDEEISENQNVVPEFDDNEDIETFLVKKDQLHLFLKERESMGDLMDSKLISYSMGQKEHQ